MNKKPHLNGIYTPSEDVVSREIEGEIIIVPLTAGIGDFEDELFTLNNTGRAIWSKLDGKNSLSSIVTLLMEEFEGTQEEMEENVLGFVTELFNRKMIVEV